MFLGGMGIIWILILVGIAVLFKESFQKKAESVVKSQGSALEILKQKYARGEIDRKDFEQKKRDLL
jgi:putative membrane protein